MSKANRERRRHGAARQGRKTACVLCGAPPVVQGMWFPGTAEVRRQVGSIVGYLLCEPCNALPDAPERAEVKLLELANLQPERN